MKHDAMIGTLIMNGMVIGFLFTWSVRMRTEMEAKMVSVERVYEYSYLLSEERIGKAVRDRRDEYFLASKCGEYSLYAEQTTAYDFSYGANPFITSPAGGAAYPKSAKKHTHMVKMSAAKNASSLRTPK